MVQHSLDHSSVEAFAAYLESWAKEDFSGRVQGNPVPVKVIVGEHDPALSAQVIPRCLDACGTTHEGKTAKLVLDGPGGGEFVIPLAPGGAWDILVSTGAPLS